MCSSEPQVYACYDSLARLMLGEKQNTSFRHLLSGL
jgi:hypothetical protein